MAKEINHTHGDTGEQPPDDLNFQSGDKPDAEIFDWFWSTVPSVVDSHADTLEAIDSDGDGKVDVADNADTATDAENVTSTYKDNDIDSDGDGIVDTADETRSFESRTNYPTNPEAGRVVFRIDKT
jgi:hypothetical protein